MITISTRSHLLVMPALKLADLSDCPCKPPTCSLKKYKKMTCPKTLAGKALLQLEERFLAGPSCHPKQSFQSFIRLILINARMTQAKFSITDHCKCLPSTGLTIGKNGYIVPIKCRSEDWFNINKHIFYKNFKQDQLINSLNYVTNLGENRIKSEANLD